MVRERIQEKQTQQNNATSTQKSCGKGKIQ